MNRILWAVPLSFVLAMTSMGTSQNTSGGLPPRLESYLTSTARLTADERKRLTGGAPVTHDVDTGDAAVPVGVPGDLSGFTGTFVRRRVRSEVQAGALSALQSTKQMLEGPR